MKYTNIFKYICFASVILIASCKKDARTTWNTELLIPIATTSLSLQNLVKDSSITVNPDNSLTLAYKSSLYQFSLADHLINIPDTSIGQKFTLDSLRLPNQSVRFNISLGYLANSMLLQPSTAFLGQYIIANQGNMSAIPALNNFSPGSFHFDATGYFDSAVLTSGTVDIWAVNNLPIPLSSGTCVLQNSSDHSFVASQAIPYIAPFDSAFLQIPIANTRITSGLDFQIQNLNTPGSNGVPVLIDTANNFLIRIYVQDRKSVV